MRFLKIYTDIPSCAYNGDNLAINITIVWTIWGDTRDRFNFHAERAEVNPIQQFFFLGRYQQLHYKINLGNFQVKNKLRYVKF